MRAAVRLPVVVAASIALAACAAGPKRNPPPPAEWAPTSGARIGGCPAIAGVYEGRGQLALEGGVMCSNINTSNKAGEWQCSPALTDNLGLTTVPFAPVVELRQPDGDTLEVVRRGDRGEEIGTDVLKRGAAFDCDAEGLVFSGTASAAPGALAVFGALVLTGGVLHHSRAFACDAAGGLVMTVRSRELMFLYGLPFGSSTTSHMRWSPLRAPEGASK